MTSVVCCSNTDCKWNDMYVCICDEINIDNTGDCMDQEDKEDDEE